MSSSAPILDTTRAGIIASQDYRDFIADLKARIHSARISAARAVNSELILLYWDIGHGILKKQQMLGWGDSVVELVAADLRREFPGATGFSAQNVWRMRQFYILHSQPEFLSQLVRGIKKSGQPVPSGEILSQAVRELVSAVPWGHHANALIRIEDPSARLWYLNRDCQENSGGNSPRKSNSPTSCARNSKIDANPPSQISPNPPPVTSHGGKAASVLRNRLPRRIPNFAFRINPTMNLSWKRTLRTASSGRSAGLCIGHAPAASFADASKTFHLTPQTLPPTFNVTTPATPLHDAHQAGYFFFPPAAR